MDCLFYDIKRVERAMDDAGLAVLIATTSFNIQYLTRFRRAGSALAVVRRDALDSPHLIVKASSIAFCLQDPCESVNIHVHGNFIRKIADSVALDEREAKLAELHNQARHEASAWDLIAEILGDAGLQRGTIGTDGTADSLAALKKALPEVTVRSTPDLFRHLRKIKTEEEINRLAEAARITEHAIRTSAQSAFLGATQRHLARVFNLTIMTANSRLRQDNASIGRGSAFGNLNTPGDVVQNGSIIRYDVGVHYEGYASDIARCFAFGKPDNKVRDIHAALVEGEDRLLETLRPGVTAAEVFHAAVDGVRKAGLPDYERTHVGHGIGIAGAGYDMPLLAPSDETPLEAGMVLCVETPYVEIGFGALQVEDMIVITQSGYRMLTHTNRHLEILP